MLRWVIQGSLLLALLLGAAVGMAQAPAAGKGQENIVPNPGFEQYDATPIGWYYKGKHFTDVMKLWSSATLASPDAYSPKVRVPANWADKGFGRAKPHTGQSMVGITLYGCENGKPHCREYIEIQLKEPLVIGQNYHIEFWVNHLPYSMRINNIGAYFSEKRIDVATETVLNFTPQYNTENIIIAKNLEWVKLSGNFQATTEGEYLLIGNFYPDSLTKFRFAWKDPLNFAYYYIDDVLVKKLEPILPVPIKDDDLTRQPLKEGETITLKNIFFEFDKAELLPRSYVELNKLQKIMKDNPRMQIEIAGHTDTLGGNDYNLQLSRKRAQAVSEYLNRKGIDRTRTRFRGYGSSKPVATNETDEGRQQNRRVEFMILKM